ncbi:hypothetical protein [Rhizobium wuzhouense]|uniref:Uncharacterized protein n=1 Tax=Rhizobium wuzhouense TaxID=1986026 RepID=A0ABX5NN15_9HYPH|nr:hypothetical protein [Rhizobium wuzhouense]PYB71501.1 hypothetical protein DMY87_18115 [Rhizobium wuzhouense]
MKTYKVLRQHLGDKMYLPGDDRKAKPADVAHLVKSGVLVESEGAKAEKLASNKAEPPVRNKAR